MHTQRTKAAHKHQPQPLPVTTLKIHNDCITFSFDQTLTSQSQSKITMKRVISNASNSGCPYLLYMYTILCTLLSLSSNTPVDVFKAPAWHGHNLFTWNKWCANKAWCWYTCMMMRQCIQLTQRLTLFWSKPWRMNATGKVKSVNLTVKLVVQLADLHLVVSGS